MKIGIIGAGNIGGTAGTLWAEAGKIVIDAMNYYPQRDGQIAMRDSTSSELAC